MKKFILLPILSLLILISVNISAFCQTSRNDARLRNLEKSIERIEFRMQKAEGQMVMGDSLITFGDRQIAEADKDFYRIADEVKKMNKEYRAKRKQLYKQTKSDNRETILQAKEDIRKLDETRRASIREYSLEVRAMKKKRLKADSDISRGQSLQKMAAKSLKASRHDLREAQERYDLAISSLK